MDLATFEWLLTPAGRALLDQAATAYADHDGEPVATATAVRRIESHPERAAAAVTQVGLRVRAVSKFGPDALTMFFTPEALQQATRRRVADHRAGRLAAAAPSSVLDLGCGIGGDLIAFARAGLLVAGVDTDPVRVAIARANLAELGLAGAVDVADGTILDLTPFGAVYADPARRGGRGRTFRVDDWVPSWDAITGLLRRNSVVKVAPGIGHDLIPGDVEAEWVSDAGDLKEASLWSGDLATCARRATVIGAGGLATLTEEDDPWYGPDTGAAPVRGVGDYLYEPDDAVIRAGLVTAVASGVDGALVDPHIAWVTGDAAFATPFARGYRVVEHLPYREKQLKAALRERNIGRLDIKKRGVDVIPEQLRKRLALRGDQAATLVMTRVDGTGAAILVEPL